MHIIHIYTRKYLADFGWINILGHQYIQYTII